LVRLMTKHFHEACKITDDICIISYKNVKPGDLVLCGGGCGKLIPYEPPYLPDQCLCAECEAIVGEMIKDGAL
jgi:hypothetical protein